MSERVEYELTQDEFDRLVEAAKPVPYIVAGGVEPRSRQENANAAWRSLGDERGFDWTTVQPVPGKGERFFSAVAS